jgi:hypothetical protein
MRGRKVRGLYNGAEAEMNEEFKRGVMLGIITMTGKRIVDETFQGHSLPPMLDLALRAKMLEMAVMTSCQHAGIEPPTAEEVNIMDEVVAKANSHCAAVEKILFQEDWR